MIENVEKSELDEYIEFKNSDTHHPMNKRCNNWEFTIEQ